MPNSASGGSVIGRALSMRPNANACMKPSRAFDHVGRAFGALLGEQRRLHALARGVAGVQPLDVAAAGDEGEQPGGARRRDAERVGELLRVEPAQLGGRHRGAERPDRAGRMEAALAQVRRAGAGQADVGLVARDDRLDQRAPRDARGRSRRSAPPG